MNTELWQKIKDFDFDHPLSEYGFSTRLANENFWTKNFTEEALLEYKKFMYLAATSEFMVSPSEIVDTVWHEHLIFTQSYQDFCTMIGKQVQHIPSTHNKEDAAKFAQAKLRTRKLYVETFGVPPDAIWVYSDMYASLELEKAKFKIRSFLLTGILVFMILIVPLYFILKPIYIHLDNPDFIIGFTALTVLTLTLLEVFNRNRLQQIVQKFNPKSFAFNLHPFELVYLKNEKLSDVINGVISEMIEKNRLSVSGQFTIDTNRTVRPVTAEEYQVFDVVDSSKNRDYPTILKKLTVKPVFTNTASCMKAFRKYFIKSKKFGALFYLNFYALAGLIMLAFIRLSTGVLREKPITFILIMLIILITITIIYLIRLTEFAFTETIPRIYKNKISVASEEWQDWRWKYFLYGNTAGNAVCSGDTLCE